MQMLRVPDVARKMGLSEVTVWRLARTDPTFPKKVKLTSNTSVFDEAEIDAYLARRIADSRKVPA